MAITTIDEYLASVPESDRAVLETLRTQIHRAAPGLEECISYGIPAFRRGRVVCGFAAFKKHLGFYLFSGDVVDRMAAELADFNTSKGTIRFTANKPIPFELVELVLLARLAECDAQDAARS